MKKVLKMAAVTALATGVSSTAMAAPAFYLGAQAGYQDTSVELSGQYREADEFGSFSAGFKDDGYSVSGVAGGIFAGIRFNYDSGFFTALEVNLGTSGADAEFSDFETGRYDDGDFSASYDYRESTKLEAGNTYGVALLAGLEVTPRTSVYGRLGYQRSKYELSYSGSESYSDSFDGFVFSDSSSFSESDKETFSGVRVGLGVETEVTEMMAVRLDWSQTHYSSKSYRFEAEEIKLEPTESLFQVGVVFKF